MNFDALADSYFDKQAAARAAADDALETDNAAELHFDDLQPTEYDGVMIDPKTNQAFLVDVDEAGQATAYPIDASQLEPADAIGLEGEDLDDVELSDMEAALAQHFLAEAGGDVVAAGERFASYLEALEAHGDDTVLREALAERDAESISAEELEDFYDTLDVDSDVGIHFLTRAAEMIDAQDVDADDVDVFSLAGEMISATREQEADAARALRHRTATTGKSWTDNLSDAYEAWSAGDVNAYEGSSNAAPAQRDDGLGPTLRTSMDDLGSKLDSLLADQDVRQRTKASVEARVRRADFT